VLKLRRLLSFMISPKCFQETSTTVSLFPMFGRRIGRILSLRPVITSW